MFPRSAVCQQLLLGGLMFALSTGGTHAAPPPGEARPSTGYDRPSPHLGQSRSVTVANDGMVATSEPLAAQVGLDVLKRGGNAADAAIAANAMIGLTEPMSCGIGGDLFVLYWDAKTSKLHGLNASGRSPFALSRDTFRALNLDAVPLDGPLSWSVPGCVDGWHELHARFGSRPWSELFAPAIAYAERGFPVSEVISRGWAASVEGLAAWPDSAATYLPAGRAPREGESFRNPRLATSYRAIATAGRDAFYRGSVGERIVAFSTANGGYFSARDFAEHRSDWVAPIAAEYRGVQVWELPPNGQGLAVLEMLNVLEGFELKSLGPADPRYWHLLIEAKKLAFADRAEYYADPAFGSLPVAELLSKEYADQQRRRIDLRRAKVGVAPGLPGGGQGDTIYLCVVDRDRNCCSLIQSNFHGFGSHVTPGDVGFCLQNRGALFSLDEKHRNRLEPHKRPFHTIIPGFATRGGRPWLVFGVMGGDMQPQGHVQVLVNQLDFGMNVQQAGDAARVRHSGSAAPTSEPEAPGGGGVEVESGISDEVVAGLRGLGHTVERSPLGGGFGGYQAIEIDFETGVLRGGSDPRKDGAAVGY